MSVASVPLSVDPEALPSPIDRLPADNAEPPLMSTLALVFSPFATDMEPLAFTDE